MFSKGIPNGWAGVLPSFQNGGSIPASVSSFLPPGSESVWAHEIPDVRRSRVADGIMIFQILMNILTELVHFTVCSSVFFHFLSLPPDLPLFVPPTLTNFKLRWCLLQPTLNSLLSACTVWNQEGHSFTYTSQPWSHRWRNLLIRLQKCVSKYRLPSYTMQPLGVLLSPFSIAGSAGCKWQ